MLTFVIRLLVYVQGCVLGAVCLPVSKYLENVQKFVLVKFCMTAYDFNIVLFVLLWCNKR